MLSCGQADCKLPVVTEGKSHKPATAGQNN